MRQDHETDPTGGAVRSAARDRLRPPTPGKRTRLVLASALMLFVELALIRWVSSNNLYLVHLTNFVLLASFLGIGLGFLRGRTGRDLFPLAPVLLSALVGFVLAFLCARARAAAAGGSSSDCSACRRCPDRSAWLSSSCSPWRR